MDPVQKIDDATSIARRSQIAAGYSLPPIVPLRTKVVVKTGQSADADADLKQRLESGTVRNIAIECPILLGLDGENLWTLPVDPIVSLSGKNIIIRRNVSKSKKRGSVKERWSQDDWSITIDGVIIGETYEDMCDYVKTLREICERGKKGVDIVSDFLNNYMDIWRIAIEDYDFPFTPGMENQRFSIKAYSDDISDLLVEVKHA